MSIVSLDPSPKRNVKLVLVGESSVGKSSLVLKLTRNQFFEFLESTVGGAFVTHIITHDGNTIKFDIWDTAGECCGNIIVDQLSRSRTFVSNFMHSLIEIRIQKYRSILL